jgi:anti-sigma28 factor (negative regulator of flagellin synthesis)
MKPVGSYLAMKTRLQRPDLNEADTRACGCAPVAEKARIAGMNSAAAAKLPTERPSFDAQKVARIKRQFASGRYHIDTQALAAKLLEAVILGAGSER